jgi:hypothetical protein
MEGNRVTPVSIFVSSAKVRINRQLCLIAHA